MKNLARGMKRLFLSVLLLALATVGAGAAESPKAYSLGDVMALALKRAESIKISEEELFYAERQMDRARSVLFPTVSAFGDHKEYADSNSEFQPDRSTSWGVRLDQSFSLSGRELTAYKVAKLGVRKGQSDLYAVKEGYIFNVAEAYFNVFMAKKALETSKANQERLNKHKEAAEARVEVGDVSRTVLLRAEAELAGAVSGTVKAEGNLKLAKSMLSSLAAIEGDFEIVEPEPDTLLFDGCSPGTASSLECLKERAAVERADLSSLAIQEKIAKGMTKYEKGAYLPRLSVEGVYVKTEEEPSLDFTADETIYGGLTLSFPIFDWGRRKAELRQAMARERQAGHAIEEAKKSINLQVERAYLELMSNKKLLESSNRQLDFARENYNLVARQFEVGLASNLDVMDANTLLVSSEMQATSAELGYQLSVLRLKKETGMLLKTYNENEE
jgi:outer membrane protein